MIRHFVYVFVTLLIQSTLAQNPAKWGTLNGRKRERNEIVDNTKCETDTNSSDAPRTPETLGDEPIVIARGGFSGLFPESTSFANEFAQTGSSILYCNLQQTKDGVGICQTDIRLDNSTNISEVYPKSQKTYNVDGEDLTGWFPFDFTSDQLLQNVTMIQNIFSRTNVFDNQLPMSTVDDVTGIKESQLWLNVQYDTFYTKQKISPAAFVQKALRFFRIPYLSSTEIGFLKSMNTKVNKAKTKLVFQFLSAEKTEASTGAKYGDLIKDLDSIKIFASAILVPKEYIWPLAKDNYLDKPTTLVTDAHKLGMEVYVSGFANDFPTAYDYHYNPVAEYLQFVDNPDFSVDGVLTDFPPTAAQAIGCFAQNKSASKPTRGQPLVISHNGASGVYAGCTDLAYQQAVDDGADIIDCSVQMSKDGVAFCLDSADLSGDTDALTTFMSKSVVIPEIQKNSGIFTFDLTWSEIQALKPQLISPMADSGFLRNPKSKNKGKFITLAEFLEFAKQKAVTGILINIENAPYLASKKGLSITDVVAKALTNATFDKQSTQQVMIQSDDTSVLSAFKSVPNYKRVLLIKEIISDALREAVTEIKKYADAVNVMRSSVLQVTESFTTNSTDVVNEMHAANISVYVGVLRNEYITIPFDLFSDPMVELATYIAGLSVDGIITDYPATASSYLRSPCSDLNLNLPTPILPANPGALLSGLEMLPPSPPPELALKAADVVDPPLPPLTNVTETEATPAPAGGVAGGGAKSSSSVLTANACASAVAIMVMCLLSWGH